ncbi:unnamed protein product [marine sediment metagenome]|uniref:HTH HARE-type domain-containing protein n=1 Tax=marine sediment metagenome TaxID=412755 RepID=X1GY91_9ZZZZ
MYALKEWGYERPTKTLYETVADIVEEKYKNTRRPVPLEVIAGELGKYRKFINPSSGLQAISRNPALKEVSRRRFLPKGACKEGHNKDETDHLDSILAEFEKEHLPVKR